MGKDKTTEKTLHSELVKTTKEKILCYINIKK